MVVDDSGSLYVAGEFEFAGGVTVNNVAKWDGTEWHPLGLGTSGPVYAMSLASDGSLVVGGDFRFSGLAESNNIALWDGEAWQRLGDGTDGVVRAVLPTTDGAIVAGGNFTRAGGRSASNIARWSDSTWQALGQGTSGSVSTFHDEGVYALYETVLGEVMVGGNFARAGSFDTRFVARWTTNGVPWIARQPSSQRIVCGQPTQLEVLLAEGYGGQYQWEKDGVALSNGVQSTGAIVQGADTASLSLLDATIADAGIYSVVISNACGLVVSREVEVTARTDLDGDFRLTIFDFLLFGSWFDSGIMEADFDGDGRLTVFDFLAFQSDFDSGC